MIPSYREFLEYEVNSSWWAGLIGNRWLQEWTARYFAWKVDRKYSAHRRQLDLKAQVEQKLNDWQWIGAKQSNPTSAGRK